MIDLLKLLPIGEWKSYGIRLSGEREAKQLCGRLFVFYKGVQVRRIVLKGSIPFYEIWVWGEPNPQKIVGL